MKTRILAILGALACAGLVVPAFANDGGAGDPAPKSEGKPAAADKKECKDAAKQGDCGAGAAKKAESPCGPSADCVSECTGPVEGGELCAEGTAKRNEVLVTLAAATGEGEAAKKVLGSIPAEAAKKVEEARKAAFDTMVKVRVEMNGLKKEIETLVAQAKAAGRQGKDEAVELLKCDAEALKARCHKSMDAFAKVLGETLGAEKVQALAADLGKAEEIAKGFFTKVETAAAAAEAEKAAKAKALEAEAEKEGAPTKDAPAEEPCKSGGGT